MQLAQEVDSRAALFAYQNASNVVGSLGTDASTINTFAAAERRLYEKACPKGLRHLVLSPSLMQSYVPVSYTHLDVYKRQLIERVRAIPLPSSRSTENARAIHAGNLRRRIELSDVRPVSYTHLSADEAPVVH